MMHVISEICCEARKCTKKLGKLLSRKTKAHLILRRGNTQTSLHIFLPLCSSVAYSVLHVFSCAYIFTQVNVYWWENCLLQVGNAEQ